MQSEIEQYLNTAVDLARHAGKTMLEGFHGTKTVTTKKSQWDLVTEFDKKVEKILTQGFYKAYPSHKFIGEETAAGDKSEPILTDAPTWIVDPIDGTTNFVHGFHLTCISIGLAINKEMVVGVIYNPILDEMYTASKGQGAKLNGIPIHTSKVTQLSQAMISYEIGFARNPNIKSQIMKRVEALVSIAQGFRALGSAAITMCYVAAGSLDAYHSNGLQCWDVAAGALIISEAGGVVMNTDGSPFDVMARKLVCAGTRKLADEIVELIKQADTL